MTHGYANATELILGRQAPILLPALRPNPYYPPSPIAPPLGRAPINYSLLSPMQKLNFPNAVTQPWMLNPYARNYFQSGPALYPNSFMGQQPGQISLATFLPLLGSVGTLMNPQAPRRYERISDEDYGKERDDDAADETDEAADRVAISRPERVIALASKTDPGYRSTRDGEERVATQGDSSSAEMHIHPPKPPGVEPERKVRSPREPDLIARNRDERKAQTAPVWPTFVRAFKRCAPGCQPVNYHAFGSRGGKRTCHTSGRAIDLHGMRCGNQHYASQGRGRFEQMVKCMRRQGLKALYFNGRDITAGHQDHAHFSIGCYNGSYY